ncbi:MAG TPA: hypothetical protein VIL22_08730 [Paenibacillaceae bacterium]
MGTTFSPNENGFLQLYTSPKTKKNPAMRFHSPILPIRTKVQLFSRENGVSGKIIALCAIILVNFVRFQAIRPKIIALLSLFRPKGFENAEINAFLSLFRRVRVVSD